MKNIGVFIVGTSPSPIYISIQNYLKNSSDSKIILLATNDTEIYKGTHIYAEKLKNVFKKQNIEIVHIDRSDLRVIGEKINNIIEAIKREEEKVSVYLDFTGGTKLQSAFIREFFESNMNFKKDELRLVYVDGYGKKITIRDRLGQGKSDITFKEIKGCDSKENMEELCYLHGFSLEFNDGYVKAISDDEKMIIKYQEVDMENYTFIFVCELENELLDNDKNKGKVKLEIFENVINAEKIGGDFSHLIFDIKKKDKKKYEKLMKEFLGIKNSIYKERIQFGEDDDE